MLIHVLKNILCGYLSPQLQGQISMLMCISDDSSRIILGNDNAEPTVKDEQDDAKREQTQTRRDDLITMANFPASCAIHKENNVIILLIRIRNKTFVS